ncbi:MAG: SDR family oxidoreductase [Chloroflexi bacterium]|nr:SDR family oxidoreductase [Chloroflexota bacterium]
MEVYSEKSVFITGAGAGIGFGLCAAFAKGGATVALNDVDEKLAQEAAVKINTAVSHPRVTPYSFDVADVLAVQKAIHDFAERHGCLDIVIANAGITQYGRFLDYTPQDFDLVTGVNLRGTFFTAQAAAKKMIELGTVDGRILLTSSVTGVRAFKSLGTYGMTKAGIIHMARVLALELGEYGITVNAICPGAIVTERTVSDDPDYAEKWGGVTPNGRAGQVQDIVDTALFLASPSAGHITGQTIQVDGGWSLRSPIPEDHPD